MVYYWNLIMPTNSYKFIQGLCIICEIFAKHEHIGSDTIVKEDSYA